MTCAQVLNAAGLVLGMVGVAIIFFYGPPQPNLEEGVALGLESGTPLSNGKTVAQHDADVARLRERHTIMSRLGLGLVFIGFALQLGGTFA